MATATGRGRGLTDTASASRANAEMDRKTGGSRTFACERPPLSEQDSALVFTFGKYQGRRLVDVPSDYLDWIYDQKWPRDALKFAIKRIRLHQISVKRKAASLRPAPWE